MTIPNNCTMRKVKTQYKTDYATERKCRANLPRLLVFFY